MTAALLAIKLICLLVVCSVGPGLWVVRKWRASPLEKLCGATAVSFILIYLASFALFLVGAPEVIYWIASAACAAIGVSNWRQAAVILRRGRSRAAVLCFIALLIWDFLHLAMIRHYGGGIWSGDWHEHYGRTRYFLHLLPTNFLFLDQYPLPARPPMMNVIAAFFCGQAGINFASYSLTFMFLNAWAFLPCCLALGMMGRRALRCIPILAILFALNPSVLQNVTYTWTKAMSAGFVILGVCFYLRGLKSKRNWRLAMSALCLAAGILVHYSAMTFAAVIFAHFCAIYFSRQRSLGESIRAGILAATLLATWFAWSILTFGLHTTLFSNSTSVGTADKTLAQNVEKFFFNCFTTLVPHPLHPAPVMWFNSLRNLGDLRDYYFMMTQTTLTMMIGATGGVVVYFLLARYFLFDRGGSKSEKRFWLWLVVGGFVLANAVNPDWGDYGGGHVTMQPLALLGITFLASRLIKLNGPVFWLVLAGVVVDYVLGILLNFDRLSYLYPTLATATGWNVGVDESLGWGRGEYSAKLVMRLMFWGDYLAGFANVFKCVSAIGAAWMVICLARMRRANSVGDMA